MKKSVYIWTAIVLVAAGCSVKSSDDKKSSDEANQAVDEMIKKSQQDVDVLTNSLYYGGQPGKITVKGMVVKKTNDQYQLDERITIAQKAGKGNKGVIQISVSEKNKAERSEVADVKPLAQLKDSKTFINIGCENLSPADTEGLKEESNKGLTESVLALSASKIFICGPQVLTQSFVSIYADQLILKDGALEVKSIVGYLTVSANNIFLEGKSSLKTSGIDSTISVLQAPTLDLVVGSEIQGEGSLLLESLGGNCVQEDEKK